MMLAVRRFDHSLCECGKPFVSHPLGTGHPPRDVGYRDGFDPETGKCAYEVGGRCRCGYGNWPELKWGQDD
jgi:hypothetical protein